MCNLHDEKVLEKCEKLAATARYSIYGLTERRGRRREGGRQRKGGKGRGGEKGRVYNLHVYCLLLQTHQAGQSQGLVMGGCVLGQAQQVELGLGMVEWVVGEEAAQQVGLVELLPVHPAVLAVFDLMCERGRGRKEGGRQRKENRGPVYNLHVHCMLLTRQVNPRD